MNATKLHESPLHMAAVAGNLLLVKILVEFGANLNQSDNRGRRPIDLVKSNSEMHELLKDYECKTNCGLLNIYSKTNSWHIAFSFALCSVQYRVTEHARLSFLCVVKPLN